MKNYLLGFKYKCLVNLTFLDAIASVGLPMSVSNTFLD